MIFVTAAAIIIAIAIAFIWSLALIAKDSGRSESRNEDARTIIDYEKAKAHRVGRLVRHVKRLRNRNRS